MENRTLAKDFHQLLKNIQGMSGGQAAVTDWEDDLTCIKVTITPSDGLYKGGHFIFEVKPDATVFSNPPRVFCQTRIYHPNIDTLEDDGEVCLNLLDEFWTEERDLEDVVQGILFLLYNPNLEDPLTCIFSPDMSEEEFEENVKISLEGGCIEGYQFSKHQINLVDDAGKKEDVVECGIEVRGDPDGAEEEVCVDEIQRNGEEENVGNVKDKNECVNDVVSECIQVHCDMDNKCNEENERVNRIECNMCEEDDGTPVDGYPWVQVIDDVKARKDATAGSAIINKPECALRNSMSYQRREDRGRLNFWWGVAIRRVRGWNVF
ncbi:uncharacterized protein [Amphiura filiformis]|uniref:uncharacterized protein n=1 Tax=Amphiura filiformis TaxID=82378 RepID=UPI003B20F3D5